MTPEKPENARKINKVALRDLDGILAAIADLKPDNSKTISGAVAVRKLAPKIREAIKRGVSIGQLAELLRGLGLELRETTLTGYLRKKQPTSRLNTKVAQPPTAQDVAVVPQGIQVAVPEEGGA